MWVAFIPFGNYVYGMKYNPAKHHRRSIRLQGYDYSQPGWYFITICSQSREMLFGDIVNRKMFLNEVGIIIKNNWLKIPELRSYIELDEFIIMPNHFHGIMIIMENSNRVRATDSVAPTLKAKSIGSILGQFKSSTTKEIQKIHIPHFRWQRNYYEHIIRNEQDLNRIRKYIRENPLKWLNDNKGRQIRPSRQH